MRSATRLFLLATILSLALNGCGPSLSPTATPEVPTPTSVPPTPTPVSPTLTPVSPMPTLVPPTPTPTPVTIIVVSAADSGPGTLRQALLDARRGDVITFDPDVFPPDAPVTITLSGGLPELSQGNLTVDASDAGVILDGSAVGGEMTPGLDIRAEGVTVRGMQIVGFSGCGIELRGQGNTIGGNRQTGSGPLGQGNLISGNNNGGVCLFDGADSNTVRGNLIGVDSAGMSAWGSQGSGVQINGGQYNLIEENVISSQRGSGISICCSTNSAYNTVKNNLIGVGSDGQTPVPNLDTGVTLADGANHNTIGPGNVIANTSGSYGISVARGLSPGNTIIGNSIYGNLTSGISLWNENMDLVRVPAIATFDLTSGEVTGVACPNCLVQIYSDEDNEGRVIEGQVTADEEGVFSFSKGSALTGPHLTATATDASGTTSMFSVPTAGPRSVPLQTGNPNPFSRLATLNASQLPDNRIGFLVQAQDWVDYGMVDATVLDRMGVKRARGQMNDADSYLVNWDTDELAIHDNFNQMISGLAGNRIRMTYNLIFWDKEWHRQTGQTTSPRFQTEEEVQRWLDFVRQMVRSFGDRVDYWEIWNEPSFEGSFQWIRVDDYISLIRRAIPVIRGEDPGAKIVVGSFHGWDGQYYREYLFRVLESDIVPLVDVITWHPFIVHLDPEECGGEFFDRYPQILSEIKSIATAHGFHGEFSADELRFSTWTPSATGSCNVFDRTAGKYYAREIVHHLGEDVATGIVWNGDTQVQVVERLGTLMAGARAESFPVEATTSANVVSYTFTLPSGDRLLAIWNNVDIADEDTTTNATLTFPGLSAQRVTGIDVLNGFEQELITEVENGNLVIRSLLVKDYPIILHIYD
jgi:hypothetical protein